MLTDASTHAIIETGRTVFVKGLRLDAEIGAYEHEVGVTQPIVVDLALEVVSPADPTVNTLEDVVCYNKMTVAIREIIARGHIRFVETLAERIAAMALAHPMVFAATVSVAKPNAISEADGAGVEIRRAKAT